MREVCNLVYFKLTDGKSPPQIAEFDALIADPKDREEMTARQNAQAMRQLQAGLGPGMGFIPTPPKKSNGGASSDS